MGEQTLDVYTKRFIYNGTRWTVRACYRQDYYVNRFNDTCFDLSIHPMYIECSRKSVVYSLSKKYNPFVFSNVINLLR